MKKLITVIRSIPSYFDKYWWSYTQDSQYYFCDKTGNIILPESYFDHNPFRHFLMCLKYDLKYWTECDSENSIFERKNYNLLEINKLCRKYKIRTSWNVQVLTDGKYVEHVDLSAKPNNTIKNEEGDINE